jgi:cytochrome P450
VKQTVPPGPRWPALIQGVAFWTRPLASYERARAKYGKRFTVRLPFTPPFVIHSDPEHVKEIYTAPPDVLAPGEGARVLEPLVGANSVILLDRDAHMEQRKLILPAFHGERMERLTDLVTQVTEDEIASWAGDEIELHPRFQALTLEIILRAVFGLDPGPRLDSLREDLSKLLAFGDSPMTLMTPPPDPDAFDRQLRLFNRIGPLKGFLDVRNRIDAALADLVTERRAEGATDRDDVLAMLLEARHEDDGSEMTQQELRDELMTLLVAGHETTASTLAWAFERVTREPAVLERLAEEAAAEDDSPYVLATIQETLRRRPVLPNTAPRLVKKPVTVGGWDYEPGVSLVANAYLVHHDPEIYPEPYAFRPERFLEQKPGTYTWIPFGGGRRRCIGMSFAMLEMRIVIRELLRAYEIRATDPDHEHPGRRNISIRPARGSRARLARRKAPVAAAA